MFCINMFIIEIMLIQRTLPNNNKILPFLRCRFFTVDPRHVILVTAVGTVSFSSTVEVLVVVV